jgi:signal transduction histidine kinase
MTGDPPQTAPPSLIRWSTAVIFALMFGTAIATTMVDSETASGLMAVSMLVALVFAGMTFIRNSRSLDHEEHRAWSLVGTGLLVTAGGIAVLVVASLLTEVRAFGPLDLVYLAGYGIGIAGFATLPHTYGNGLLRIRLLLDGLIGAVAVVTLIWALFLREIAEALSDAPVLDGIIGATYVFLDVALLVVLMIVVVRRSNLRFDLRIMLFGLAAITQAIADMAFLLSGAGNTFAEAEPIYFIHIVAVILFIATSLLVDRVPEEREYAERTTTPAWAMVLPYGFATVLVGALVIRFPQTGASSTDQALLHATVLVALLVIARQAIAIRENRRLVEDQRTDLVASISHELRTPLTSIVGFLDLLDVGTFTDEEERQEVTSIVTHQAGYMARIVSDLVMLASDTITTMDLQIEATKIDALAWSSVNTAVIDPSLVRVDAEQNVTAFLDEGRMEQAIANFLGNAVRYGGEKVTVIARAHAGDLTIEVHDDGPGVPRKYELMIWEKFERGPNRLNATVPGSGIGLAVTNAIAKAHGGSAGYRRSERLGGACFWIRLPGRVREHRPVARETGAKLSVVEDDVKTA